MITKKSTLNCVLFFIYYLSFFLFFLNPKIENNPNVDNIEDEVFGNSSFLIVASLLSEFTSLSGVETTSFLSVIGLTLLLSSPTTDFSFLFSNGLLLSLTRE